MCELLELRGGSNTCGLWACGSGEKVAAQQTNKRFSFILATCKFGLELVAAVVTMEITGVRCRQKGQNKFL